MEGWIKLYRKIWGSDIWPRGKFSNLEAWLDMLMMANHAENNGCPRGAFVTSQRFLETRWKWSRWKVRYFLHHLSVAQMIHENCTTNHTTIHIINYDSYQSEPPTNHTTKSPRKAQIQECKECKEEINIKNKTYSEDFLKFFEAYPVKKGKSPAWKAWQKKNPNIDIILEAIKQQKEEKKKLLSSNKFTPEWPLPATWINQERWMDETEERLEPHTILKLENNGTLNSPQMEHMRLIEEAIRKGWS